MLLSSADLLAGLIYGTIYQRISRDAFWTFFLPSLLLLSLIRGLYGLGGAYYKSTDL